MRNLSPLLDASLVLLLLSLPMVAFARNDPVVCPIAGRSYVDEDGLNTLKSGGMRELSGMAISPTQKGPSGEPVIFAVTDGEGDPMIGVWDSGTGERLLMLGLDRRYVAKRDWEAMAIGSCGNTGPTDTCLYIADVGSNTAMKSHGKREGRFDVPFRLTKVREPKLSHFEDFDLIPTSYYSILEFDYFHDSSPTKYANSETIFVDHGGWGQGESIGDVYVVTKWGGSKDPYELTRLFKIPISAWPDTYCAALVKYSPQAVGSYEYEMKRDVVGGGQLLGRSWRGGEMSFDGTVIALATKTVALLFLRCPGTSVADTLAGPNASSKACLELSHPAGGQVESFAWTPEGERVVQTKEGRNPPLGWTNLEYDSSKTSEKCSQSSLPALPPLSTPSKDTLEVCAPTPERTFSPAPTFEGETRAPSVKPTMRPTKAPTIKPVPPTNVPARLTDNPTIAPTKVDPVETAEPINTAQSQPPASPVSVFTMEPSTTSAAGYSGTVLKCLLPIMASIPMLILG